MLQNQRLIKTRSFLRELEILQKQVIPIQEMKPGAGRCEDALGRIKEGEPLCLEENEKVALEV